MASPDHQYIFAAVAQQRHQFASLISDLDEAQLATPSLCEGWDVKTVAAHVVSTVLDGTPGFLQMAIRQGSLSRGIDVLARRLTLAVRDFRQRFASHRLSRWTISKDIGY